MGIILFIAIYYFSFYEKTKTTVLQDRPKKIESRLCFLNKSQSGVDKEKYNIDYIEVNLVDDIRDKAQSAVSGKVINIPYGTDSFSGDFVGAFDGVFLNILLTAKSEGKT